MNNREHDKFRPPRYKLLGYCPYSGATQYYDCERGMGFNVPNYNKWQLERAKSNHFEITNTGGRRETPNNKNEAGGKGKNNNIPYEFDEEIKLIIGVTIEIRRPRIGAHAFVMYINEPNNPEREWRREIWGEDIMLDASGHFGMTVFRGSSDIVLPGALPPSPISIDRYRRWFHQ